MIQPNSFLMNICLKFGLTKVAWSLRRLYCPVGKADLVLEVGSGGSPYYRANVLCDAYEDTEERFFAPLIYDRPTVIAHVENLPFKDNSFDFVIASHVLEHSSDPDQFLKEIQRVSKAGYIEVPDAFMERLTHYNFHKLEITDKDGKLLITKKKDYIHDQDVVELFHNKARSIFPVWAGQFPFHFHVRYYWSKDKGGIQYIISNPEVDLSWQPPENNETVSPLGLKDQTTSYKARVKASILSLARQFFSQNSRNSNLDMLSLMRCPKCKNEKLKLQPNYTECLSCQTQVKILLPL